MIRKLQAGLAVLLGAGLYLYIAGFTVPAMIALTVAIGLTAAAWRLEASHDLDGWAKLFALMLGAVALLAGDNWRAGVPWQFLLSTTTTILILGIFALGLSLEFGFAGLINFGHVAFMAVGAYTVVLLALQGGFWAGEGGVWVALALGLLGAAAFGVLLAIPAIRLRADYLAIVTIAAAELGRKVLENETWWSYGPSGTNISPEARPLDLAWIEGIPGIGPIVVDGLTRLQTLLGFRGEAYILVLILVAIACLVLVVRISERLVQSPWGRCLRAIREDEDAARALGLNPTIYKLQVFAIGSAIAALAGALWAWQNFAIAPRTFRPLVTFWAWIAIIIGGVGNNKGAIAGAFLFWTINTLTQGLDQLSQFGLDTEQIAAFSTLALGLLIIGFMVYKPEGLFGDREELELVE